MWTSDNSLAGTGIRHRGHEDRMLVDIWQQTSRDRAEDMLWEPVALGAGGRLFSFTRKKM